MPEVVEVVEVAADSTTVVPFVITVPEDAADPSSAGEAQELLPGDVRHIEQSVGNVWPMGWHEWSSTPMLR